MQIKLCFVDAFVYKRREMLIADRAKKGLNMVRGLKHGFHY